jgi:hypothetical protein
MYPTLEQVNVAPHIEICRWWRFLPSPGAGSIKNGGKDFDIALESELLIMNRIAERLQELGGFTPEISKAIGWVR